MLSWNEIRFRAQKFSRDWEGETRETGEYQSFWNEFFEVFGLKRRNVALYQRKVELLGDSRGFIDLLWPGTLLAEHKSAGQPLDAAFTQATDYFQALSEEEKPRYIIVTDYRAVRLYDLEGEKGIEEHEFPIGDFSKHVRLFAFMAGYEARAYRDEAPVNAKAVKAVAKLYEALISANYPKDAVDKLLTRLVFCFFADDTGIFNKGTFAAYMERATREDGSDVGAQLSTVFQILDTPSDKRQNTTDEDLAGLPYVNGGLFAGFLPSVFGTTDIRKTLLSCMAFDWSAVSPVIFGSMFQSVMDDDARHDVGAHYTSEKNILKLIGGLFLDDLERELADAGTNHAKLNALWTKIAKITLLDPACGCGNFLVVAYRELRRIEFEILKRIYRKEVEAGQSALPFDVSHVSKLSVERMFGIEILPFPAEIARLSLWLMDHLSNIELGDYFGTPFAKLPITESPHIVQDDALTLDWESVVPKEKLSYILGNPPFIGSKVMSDAQRAQITGLFGEASGSGTLDYVCGWYIKAAYYVQGTNIHCAFVSTNSITQGEQVGVLWSSLLPLGIHLTFAHRTFKWTNEAPGKAAVFCVILGFTAGNVKDIRLFDYEDVRDEPHALTVPELNPYLVVAPSDIIIRSRQKPLCGVPEIGIGNQPIDGGFYLFTTEEKEVFLQKAPAAAPYFRRWLGSDEFLNGWERWCLWLGDCPPEQLQKMPEALRRVEAVREYRLLSKRAATSRLADTPTRFQVENMPKSNYLIIPEVSSERRHYIPIGFMGPETLASNLLKIVPNATLYHFGILESEMHMAWVRTVCGRLESRYRYSKDIVYNNFPWPEEVTENLKMEVEKTAQYVLDVRKTFPDATLAQLYNPETMPKALLDAHHTLDRTVDRCYGKRTFKTEAERVGFLFALYKEYAEKQLMLEHVEGKKGRGRKQKV